MRRSDPLGYLGVEADSLMLCCAPFGANAAYLRATASARSAVRSAKPISPGILINVHPARDRAPAAWPVPTGAGGNPGSGGGIRIDPACRFGRSLMKRPKLTPT